MTLLAPNSVIGLRVEGTMIVYELRRAQRAFILGSSEAADLRIAHDLTVSRMHCALLRERDGRILVLDRDSRNGTFIAPAVAGAEGAEVRVRQAYLADQDRLRVGRTTLIAFSQRSRETMSEGEARHAFRVAITSAMAKGSIRVAARSLGVATTLLRQLAKGNR